MTEARWPVLALVGVLLMAGAPASGTETSAPRAVIESTLNEVLAILQDPALDDAARRSRIEQIANDRFHFDTMSRLVLARRWRRFSEEQRRAFVEEFRSLLSRSYGRRINRYEQEQVEIVGERSEARGDVTVQTRIVGGAVDGAEVDYRLRERDGAWGVIDVVIEGVSLVSNYRSQFSEVLGNGTPDDLLQQLREKNAKGGEPEV